MMFSVCVKNQSNIIIWTEKCKSNVCPFAKISKSDKIELQTYLNNNNVWSDGAPHDNAQ